MRAQDLPARERLLAKLEPQPDGCHYWTGRIDASGYGRVGYKGRTNVTVQRAVYDCFVGPIPAGYDVDHVCHNRDLECVRRGTDCRHRRCGNPAHLEAIPREVNGMRATKRLTHCPHGHPYSGDNLRVSQGRRFCRTCARAAAAASKRKAAVA